MNEPYQRVNNHDPVYNGIAIGALSGAAGLGAVHSTMKGLTARSRQAVRNTMYVDPQGTAIPGSKAKGVGGKGGQLYNKAFKGGWRKAGVYAGASLLGAGLGAGLDYMTD